MLPRHIKKVLFCCIFAQYSWASLVAQLVKNLTAMQKTWGFGSWVGRIPWRREWPPTPVFWPGEFHGLYSPWVYKESDMTERVSLSLHSSCSAGFEKGLLCFSISGKMDTLMEPIWTLLSNYFQLLFFPLYCLFDI